MNRVAQASGRICMPAALCFLAAAAVHCAQDGGPCYTRLEDVPESYHIQGEYAGSFEAVDGAAGKLGCQVAALGSARFEAVFLPGGLPGAGWTGSERIVCAGRRAEAGTEFGDGGGWRAVVADGRVTGTDPAGRMFRLERLVRSGPTHGAPPPAEAMVLFDGSGTGEWVKGRMDERGLLACDAVTRRSFRDFVLHVEFVTPFKPEASRQARGNSGIYLQRRYEVQILDSFGSEGRSNECGGLYRQRAPDVNMCLPPLVWQAYDIDFAAARFDADGKRTTPARITVRHNGVLIHDDVELTGKTGAGRPEGPEPGPILLQGHGNPVYFRNVWIVER